MSVLFVRCKPGEPVRLVSESGDEIDSLMSRVTGRANDAAITLREAIDMIDADDDANLPIKMRLANVLGQLRAAIREADVS